MLETLNGRPEDDDETDEPEPVDDPPVETEHQRIAPGERRVIPRRAPSKPSHFWEDFDPRRVQLPRIFGRSPR